MRIRNDEMEQFVYSASHDLKTPIRGIENLAHWIMEDAGDVLPKESKVHLQKLISRVDRLTILLDDLLEFSRIGRFKYETETVTPYVIIQDTIEVLGLPDTVEIHINCAELNIDAQIVPMATVLRNLIDNAVKHNPQTPCKIWIDSRQVDSMIEFVVRDNGPGIPKAFQERIFQIFQMLKPRDDIEGSGMGLAIVKKIVENYGGTISLESVTGKGSTFRFTFPVSVNALAPDPEEA